MRATAARRDAIGRCGWFRRSIAILLVVAAASSSGGLVLRPAAAGSAAQAKIRVSPAIALGPTDLRVQFMFERSPDNRSLRITADGDDYFSSSEVTLDGDRSPGVRFMLFRSVPPGSYELRGELLGPGGTIRSSAQTSALVMER
jgi:hypothetical protein